MVSTRLGRGRILIFDYCSASTREVAASTWREWLRTYKDHGRGEHYLANPGSQDITVQVMLDQLANSFPQLTVSRQSEWLKHWGIEQLVDEGNQYWDAHKHAPNLAAMKMRSRQNESDALVSETSLGRFWVLQVVKQ
jgi:SAM-dependent MidA family methyltransferase